MALGVQFRIDGDGSKAVGAINSVQSAMDNLTNTVKGEISSKLKVLFSAAAIEEAARRTGEWANQLDRSARAMGISATALQTLTLIAQKANAPEDAVIGMFENIDKARNDALKGNTDLLLSFQRLGVSLEDLQNMSKSDLFDKLTANIPDNVQNSQNITRQDVQSITGTPENVINQITSQLKGEGGFNNTMTNAINSGDVVKEDDVNQLSATWNEIKAELTQVGNDLKPLAKILLGLIATIIKAVGAITSTIKGIIDIAVGIFTGDWKKIAGGAKSLGGILTGMAFGVLKLFTNLFDILGKALVGLLKTILSKVPFIGDKLGKGLDKVLDAMNPEKGGTNLTKIVDNAEKNYKDFYGNKNISRGEAATDVATIIATGGEAAIARAGSGALMKSATLLDKIGFEGTAYKLVDKSLKLDRVGRGETGFFTKKPLLSYGKNPIPENTIAKTVENPQLEFKGLKLNVENGVKDETFGVNKTVQNYTLNAYKEFMRQRRIFGASALSLIGASTNTLTNTKNQAPSDSIKPILPYNSLFGETKGGNGSMLNIGGVFGSNFQSRIIKLNEQMVRLLSQITVNTQAGRGAGFNGPSTPNSSYGGGL